MEMDVDARGLQSTYTTLDRALATKRLDDPHSQQECERTHYILLVSTTIDSKREERDRIP